MIKIYFTLSVFILTLQSGISFAQDQLSRDFSPIKKQLTNWDAVRGEWLAESMLAMSKNEPIPDRTFPEDFTPAEMMGKVPPADRQQIQDRVNQNIASQGNGSNRNNWNNISNFMQTPNCQPLSGRSHGDPHLVSFDGKSFSLQTVGEFVLAKSVAERFEVQTRQRADGEDFSLNTAVAMNVGGDRVCIYADDKPDQDFSNPLRIDGQSIRVSESTYYLPRGGNIRNKGNEYVITWPTGESVTCQINNRTKFSFINISTQIYPCIPGGYEGLLGNANGTPDDDIDTRNNRYDYSSANRFNTVFGGQTATMSNEAEKEYLVYLAKEFGNAWRLTEFNSLFDYAAGLSTISYTDFSFPRYHRTVRDLSQNQRDAARRDCEQNGIRGNELYGCIFDNAYVNLKPTPAPVHRDPTRDVVLRPVENGRILRNVNPPRTVESTPAKVVAPAVVSQPEISKKPIATKKPLAVENKEVAPTISTAKPVSVHSNVGSQEAVSPAKNPVTKPANVDRSATKPVVNSPAVIIPSSKVQPPVANPSREVKAPAKEVPLILPAKKTIETEKKPEVVKPQRSGIIAPPKATPAPVIRGGR